MRNILLTLTIVFCGLGNFVWAQPGSPKTSTFYVVKDLNHDFFKSVDSVKTASPPTWVFGKDTITADTVLPRQAQCMINGTTPIRFGRAFYENETLVLELSERTILVKHTLRIEIKGKAVSTRYLFYPPRATTPIEVIATDQLLLLNTDDLAVGKTVSGIINFRGTSAEIPNESSDWNPRTDHVESSYVIKGAFQLQIQ